MMSKNTPLITKRTYIEHGGITGKDTVYSKDKAKLQGYIPMVTSDEKLADVTKYGGRTSINNQCYSLVSYTVKGKKVLSLEAVPIYIGNIEEISDERLLDYFQKTLECENSGKELKNLEIKIRCIRYKTLIKLDGFYYFIAGKTGNSIYLENAEPLLLDSYWSKYVKKLEKAYSSDNYTEQNKKGLLIITSEDNLRLYDILTEKLSLTGYKNKKTSIVNILEKGRKAFSEKNLSEQTYVILQIIMWFNLNCVCVDLKLINGSTNSGLCRINKKITDCKEAKLYLTSPAGLYRKEIDLLSL
jgi:CRISPR-associated endonuclease Csn1